MVNQISNLVKNYAVKLPSAESAIYKQHTDVNHLTTTVDKRSDNTNHQKQQRIDEAVIKLSDDKNQQWQLLLGKSYVETQKAAINAYSISATGESVYNEKPLSLTYLYDKAYKKDIDIEYGVLPKPMAISNDELSFERISAVEQNKVVQYLAIQKPRENSFIHMSV